MSRESLERAREGYEALARAVQTGSLDEFLAHYIHPELELVAMAGSPDSVSVKTGHTAVEERLTEILEAMDEPRIVAEEFIDGGEKIVVALRMSGRGKASGIVVEGRRFQVVTEREQKAARIEWYADRSEALKAVGLEE